MVGEKSRFSLTLQKLFLTDWLVSDISSHEEKENTPTYLTNELSLEASSNHKTVLHRHCADLGQCQTL